VYQTKCLTTIQYLHGSSEGMEHKGGQLLAYDATATKPSFEKKRQGVK